MSPAPTDDGPAIDSSTRLCLACGLCCRGVLHRYVSLRKDEEPLASNLGLEVIRDSAEPSFALPCLRYVHDTCSIYDSRPSSCRSYRCHLLERLEDGAVDLERALEVVARARALMQTLGKQAGFDGDGPWQPDRLSEFLEGEADPETRLTAGEFLALCRRELKPRRQGSD